MPKTKARQTQIKQAGTYQEMKAELDDIMLSLQREDLGVDDAVGLYERGLELLRSIESYLKTAESKVTELNARFNDTP